MWHVEPHKSNLYATASGLPEASIALIFAVVVPDKANTSRRPSYPQYHDLGRFDEGGSSLSRFQAHLAGGTGRDN